MTYIIGGWAQQNLHILPPKKELCRDPHDSNQLPLTTGEYFMCITNLLVRFTQGRDGNGWVAGIIINDFYGSFMIIPYV